LIGRLEGPANSRTLLMGSHQDSVRHGGRYDGIMGVVLPLVALRRLGAEGLRLPFAVEVLAFADEEGVRFPTALMGPRALADTFAPEALDLRDQDGIALARALRSFGGDPAQIAGLARAPATLLGYVECHIEQGPVLERAGLALGTVTAICGIERHPVVLSGEAGHAGTIPMALRRDALTGAAEIALALETLARETEGLLATVGEMHILPNAVNAVPGEARFTLELRHPEDPRREEAGAEITRIAREIAARRGLGIEIHRSYAQAATPCDPQLSERLEEAARQVTGRAQRLASGATHDASAMAALCPVAMLFTACRAGLSHHPEEYASPEDMAAAVATLALFLRRLGTN
ncbi:M20 family metallo-hydrolase, partial [Thioclava sp. BHET1]